MSTHDYIVDNQNGANFRSDLNNALAAIVSNNSKATAPTTTYAFMWWADTAADILKQRNAADSAWINILTLSTGAIPSANLSGALPAIDGSALTGVGKVLQIVQGTTSTQVANSTTTYTDTNLTATITPASTASKILVVVNQNGGFANHISTTNGLTLKLLRGATDLTIFAESAGYTATALRQYLTTMSTEYLDSPATTAATTYKTQMKNIIPGAEVYVQAGSLTTSTITLMEIGV